MTMPSHHHLALAALAVSIPAARGVADTVDIPPVRDTTLYETADGALSNGAGEYGFTGRTLQGEEAIRRGLMAFDIAGTLPPDATINGVSLRLHVSRVRFASPATVGLHRVRSDWGEAGSQAGGMEGGGGAADPGDATWLHTFFADVFWTTPGGDFEPVASGQTTVSGVGTYTWPSTPGMLADAQDWFDDPAGNHGWIIIGNETSGGSAKRYNAREFTGSPTLRPRLTIDFTPGASGGACCLLDGTCLLVAEESLCDDAGGVFQGVGSPCTPTLCPQLTNACCFTDGTCAELLTEDCDAQGGVPQAATACADVQCPVALVPFVDPLPLPAVAQPEPGDPNAYVIAIQQVEQQLHRDLAPTTVWAYDGLYPGPTFEAVRDEPITVTWVNDLRDETGALRTDHYLPVDPCPHGAAVNDPRVVVHLHGGHVPSEVDGYPEDTILPGEQVVYEYPNNQPAATIWYHDHALGITRLNVQLGLAGFYLIRDEVEAALDLPAGDHEIALAIQDRTFDADGEFIYPAEWTEHFFGDTILVNGKVWPYLEVDQGKYRFRILNGSNARTYVLSLGGGLTFTQIGTDGGLLPAPVELSELTLASGERADVVVDFAGLAEGTEILLTNSAPAPFPGTPGVGVIPDVMKFVVTGDPGDQDPLPSALVPVPRIPESKALHERTFELAKRPEACAGSEWVINGLTWDDITERPRRDTVEIWDFINRSGDMHPMHMHLVFFQVLDRQPFTIVDGEIVPVGDPVPPPPEEAGWKDTVKVMPLEIVRVIARFEDYEGLFPYHCHILEHEDHEMMRQFEVRAPCPGDVTGDSVVAFDDQLSIIAGWGPCGACVEDIDGDGVVGFEDLLTVLGSWGLCPDP